MNRIDFGKLVASLRKEHQDEEGAHWTQCELAQRANSAAGVQLFNEDIISFIERGKRSLDRQTLLALATALQLTSNERREFFLAASGIDAQEIACQETSPEEVFSQLIESIRTLYLPTTVVDAYCDVLAVNYVILELFDFPSAYGLIPGTRRDNPYGYNLLHFIFSEDGSQHFINIMGNGFSDFAYTAVNIFRTFSLAYRSTEYFSNLLGELRKSRLFRRYWSEIYFAENERQFRNADIRANSPKWGPLLLNFATKTAYTTAGELHLAVFVPADQKTANVCGQILHQIDVPTIFYLTPWPNKNTP
jgi:transcriptional regulator with XRE-family HTH domain